MATEIHIHLDAGRLNFPLRTIWQGELSSADLVLRGVPAGFEAVGVVFGVEGGEETFRAEAARDGDTWRAYASPYVFPRAGLGMEYSVVGTDAHGNARWLGTGQLNVVECPANGSSDVPPIVPRDTYIRNPVTGLYHLLTATVDEDGNLTLHLSDEGETR